MKFVSVAITSWYQYASKDPPGMPDCWTAFAWWNMYLSLLHSRGRP